MASVARDVNNETMKRHFRSRTSSPKRRGRSPRLNHHLLETNHHQNLRHHHHLHHHSENRRWRLEGDNQHHTTFINSTTTICHYHNHNHHHLSLALSKQETHLEQWNAALKDVRTFDDEATPLDRSMIEQLGQNEVSIIHF